MKKLINAKLYLVLLLCTTHLGCASYIRFHDSPGLTYEKLNRKLSGREVVITLVDEQVFSGTEVKIAEDSTSWRDIDTSALVRMSTNSIHKVTIYKSRTRDGLLLGFVSAFITGAIIGYARGEDCELDQEDCIDRETTALLLGTLLAVPGLLIGTIAGATTRRPSHYILHQIDEE